MIISALAIVAAARQPLERTGLVTIGIRDLSVVRTVRAGEGGYWDGVGFIIATASKSASGEAKGSVKTFEYYRPLKKGDHGGPVWPDSQWQVQKGDEVVQGVTVVAESLEGIIPNIVKFLLGPFHRAVTGMAALAETKSGWPGALGETKPLHPELHFGTGATDRLVAQLDDQIIEQGSVRKIGTLFLKAVVESVDEDGVPHCRYSWFSDTGNHVRLEGRATSLDCRLFENAFRFELDGKDGAYLAHVRMESSTG